MTKPWLFLSLYDLTRRIVKSEYSRAPGYDVDVMVMAETIQDLEVVE